ncbi:hypothetical protein NX059_008990 [Plenodomus lindquistii]|nr:hypothetical protein NX059_008990 [Plenodomus lindquistii]
MKSFKPDHATAGHRECRILKFLANEGTIHAHLVKHYAAFHHPSPTNVHIVCELVDCSLLQLIGNHPQGKANISLDDDWLKQQFRGVASALAIVQGSEVFQKILHHDLTLDNILVLKLDNQTEKYRFKITGWGSGSRSQRSHHHQNDEFHRPPEWLKGATSYPHDIWSLGCVCLRTLTWFLEGSSGYARFMEDLLKENRMEFRQGNETAAYFFMLGGGSHAAASTVVAKIAQYQKTVSISPWKPSLQTLDKMLEIKEDARIKVDDLVHELQSM